MPNDDTPTKEQARVAVKACRPDVGWAADVLEARLAHLEAENERLEKERDEARAELERLRQIMTRAFGYLPVIPDAPVWVDYNLDAHIRALTDEWMIRERQLEATRAKLEQVERQGETLKREAEQWAQEARAQRATVQEIYQLCTGATGGVVGAFAPAEPVRALVAELKRLREAARAVTWFDFAEDDRDVQEAVERLRTALRAQRDEENER